MVIVEKPFGLFLGTSVCIMKKYTHLQAIALLRIMININQPTNKGLSLHGSPIRLLGLLSGTILAKEHLENMRYSLPRGLMQNVHYFDAVTLPLN
jgi:hypothetical protein